MLDPRVKQEIEDWVALVPHDPSLTFGCSFRWGDGSLRAPPVGFRRPPRVFHFPARPPQSAPPVVFYIGDSDDDKLD